MVSESSKKRPNDETVLDLKRQIHAAANGERPWFAKIFRDFGFFNAHRMTGQEVASIFSVSAAAVTKWSRDGCPRKGAHYNFPDVLQWRIEKLTVPKGMDPMLAGDNTPALERYRYAAAQLKEIDVAERQGVVIPLDDMREILGQFAIILKGVGETLGKNFGKEAQQIVNEGVDEFQAGLEKALKKKEKR